MIGTTAGCTSHCPVASPVIAPLSPAVHCAGFTERLSTRSESDDVRSAGSSAPRMLSVPESSSKISTFTGMLPAAVSIVLLNGQSGVMSSSSSIELDLFSNSSPAMLTMP
jgi:hypothetical protein